MKKLLLCAFPLLALCANAFANTNIYDNKLFLDGELRTGFIADHNVPARTNAGAMRDYWAAPTRLLLGFGYEPVENIRLNAKGVFYTHWNHNPTPRPGTIDTQTDKLQLAEANIEIKNIFDNITLKLGRQFFYMYEECFWYNESNYERLIYRSLDGVTATAEIFNTKFTLASGKEADLADWSDLRYIFTGLWADANIYKNFNTLFIAANYARTDDAPSWGFYGAKPYWRTENTFIAFEYLRDYERDIFHRDAQSQFFQITASQKMEFETFSLTPRAEITWTTGPAFWNVDYLTGIMIGHIYWSAALQDAVTYNGGVDINLNALPKATLAADAVYYGSRKAGVPAKGTEVDLMLKYRLSPSIYFGAGGAYLFANEAFQAKDATKVQTWFVYSF